MFWFKDPATLTIWTRGLLTALNVSINWRHNLHQRQESEVALEQAALGRGDDFERYHGGSSGSRNGTSHSPFLWVEGGAKLAERNGSTGSATTVTNESLHEQWEGEGSVVSKSEGPVEAGSLPIDLLGVVLTSNEVETEKRPRAPSLKKDLASNLTDLGDERFNRSSIRDAVLSPYINGADTSLLGSLSQDGDSLKRGGEEHLLDEPPFLNFVDVPWEGAFSTCFDDAVLLSSPTNGAFIPDSAANDWLRSQALRHCGVEEELAPKVVKKAVILAPPVGQGSLINKEEMARLLTDIVGLEVEQRRIEGVAFCDQVRAIASEDFLVVPHGSQNVNLIFAKPGAIVMEVFPYLYYTNFIGNYIHAARLRHLQVLGSRPPWSPLLWIYSWFGWDTCFGVPACRGYARRQNIYVDTRKFETLLWQLVNDCVLVGEASPARCRN